VNALVGNFEVPLTGRELLIALRDGKSVQIGRSFLGKALLLIEQCAEACIDVRTEGDKAFLAPERFRMTETGEKAIANAVAVPRRNDVGTNPLLAVSESGDK
jgi:hypothetical protein